MAPAETSHLFAKLKIDTSSKPPAASPLSRQESCDSFQTITQKDGQNTFELSEPPLPSVVHRSPLLSPDALASERYALHDVQEGVVQNYHEIEHSEPQGIPGRVARSSQGESDTGSRRSSISFASNVTLDNGGQFPVEEALPKPDTRLRPRGRSILEEIYGSRGKLHRTASESRRDEYDLRTGQRLDHKLRDPHGYQQGIMRHPLLQSTVDDLARHPEPVDERIASLTSDGTASPVVDEARTPPDYEGSSPKPLPVSSPFAIGSSSLPFSQRNAQRSRSYRDVTTTRKSRRSSARSAHSSKSPASNFLSMWASNDPAPGLIEPDEEGQEIGDHSGYIIGRQIGVGGFSVVKEVFSFENGVKIRQAVKIVRKQVSGKNDEDNEQVQNEFEHEVSVWRYLKHRYILPLLAVYESPFATFCITRLNDGGTLFDIIHSNRKSAEPGLSSDRVKRYAYQLASAVRYLHEDVRVVHRDLKIENVLIDMTAPNAQETGGDVLLCDFGMADFIHSESRGDDPEPFDQELHIGPSHTSTSVTGSLRYAAPELLATHHQLYSTAVDMWAFGCIVYTLLTNKLTFNDPFEPRVTMQIMRGEWDVAPLYKSRALRGKPQDREHAIALVKGCLEKDPERRWTISDVLESPWLAECAEKFEDLDCDWS